MIPRLPLAALAFVCLTPGLRADDAKKPESYQVPYRLSDTNHLIVRAKINGKGPFNLIVDTGAPALYLSEAVGKKAGLTADKKGWATCERFELEGGLKLNKPRSRVEPVPQIEGMNALNAAGVELHGLMGYSVLAQFRIEYDLTRDKLTWARVTDKADLPERMGKGSPTGLEVVAGLMKLAGMLMGRQDSAIVTRGFLGVELADDDGAAIKAVLAKSPADEAGIKPGDRITRFQSKPVARIADLYPLAAKIREGQTATLTVRRGEATKEITIKAGKGL